MGKTYKDAPKYKPKEGFKKPKDKRPIPSKGRKPHGNLKDLVRDGRDLEDYFI